MVKMIVNRNMQKLTVNSTAKKLSYFKSDVEIGLAISKKPLVEHSDFNEKYGEKFM